MATKELTDLSVANSPQDIFANAGTAQQIQSTGFKVDIPDTVPSTSLVEGGTKSDVRARRNQMESEQIASQQFDADLGALNTRINTPAQTPISNPEEFINRLLLNRPTDTQTALDTEKQGQANATRGFAQTLDETGQQAREQFALPELQSSLAETRNRISERTVQLRQALRDFETNAKQRGVAREFVQAEKQKIQADAAAELADLAIIESAQLGNLQQAQQDVDRVINEKVRAFELENAAIEQEIARLESINTRESKVRSEQLQIALNERQRNEEKLIADEKQRLNYLSEAAANGADQGTLDAIRNATTPGEAALLAGPFIGRLERAKTQASIAASVASTYGTYENVRLRGEELQLAKDKFEAESKDFGTGTITLQDGTKAVVATDGTVTPVSQIDFSDASQVDALPVSNLTKAIIQGIGKTKDLTPTQKGEVLSELQQIGFNPNSYVVSKLNSLIENWVGMPESSRGLIQGAKFWESKTNEEVAKFESQRTLLTREIARLFDVGILSDQDVASYKEAMPSRFDTSIDVVLNKAAGIAGAAAGINPQNVGKRIQLNDGRQAIVGVDGETLLDPATGKPLE